MGLPAQNEGEFDEDVLLECLNLLPLDPPVRTDISIFYEVPSCK